LETAGSEVLNGAAREVTVASPRVSRASMARRVGSARAWKTRSSWVGELLTIWFNIVDTFEFVKTPRA
jgi:hypothetical protein